MNRYFSFFTIVGTMMLLLLLGANFATAADLTGSYEGTIACSIASPVGDPGQTTSKMFYAEAFLSPEVASSSFESTAFYRMHYIYGYDEGNPAGYKASHLVSTLEMHSSRNSNGIEKGIFTALPCGTYLHGGPDSSLAFRSAEFGTGEYKILPNGTASIDLDYFREYMPYHFRCKLDLTRISSADPLVTRDGPDIYSEPQEYRCPDMPF